ncbi:MAG: DMT family transporter [Microcoleaceae cyanobacterium MO_207.B10]|nr:DMT family transporter [Microcoleaceae cyanobacterium MO_207.B10]
MTSQIQLLPQNSAQKSTFFSLIALLVGLLAVSLAAIFIRLSERELGPASTILDRFVISGLVLWFWSNFQAQKNQSSANKNNSTYTFRECIWLLAGGFTFAPSLVLWAWSLTQTNVANSTILHNMIPIFTALGGWMFLSLRFDRRFLIGMAIAIVGAIAIGADDIQVDLQHFAGDLAAFSSAILFGAYYLLIEQLRSKFSATTILLWTCIGGSLFTLPIALLTEDHILPFSWEGWLSIIGLAVIAQVLGHGFVTYSLKTFSSGFVALCFLLEPVITALIAWGLFSEQLTIISWLGFFIVLLGLYLAQSSPSIQKASH